MLIGYDPDCDFYYDPQQAKTQCLCLVCRREIYTPGRDVHEECEDG